MLNVRVVRAFLVLVLQVPAACSENGPEPTVAGEWHLTSIDGQPLPQPYDATSSIIEERLVLEPDGGFHQFQTRMPAGPSSSTIGQHVSGIWLRSGNELTFATISAVADLSFKARLSGGTDLRRTRQGSEWIYRRQ